MNNSATVRMKYRPIIIHGVTRIAFISAALIVPNTSFEGNVKENTIKEVNEEAGLNVSADLVIAVQDREKHNLPIYAYKVCKVFVLCSVIDGSFQENIETVESKYFGIDELPILATEKNTKDQIAMCFDAYYAKNWVTLFD